jgi:CBS domain-containing protein
VRPARFARNPEEYAMADRPIRDLIRSRKVDFVTADMSVHHVARYMAKVRRGAVPVIEEGQLVGIFSERDLMLRVVLADRDPAKTPVRDVMTRDLVVAQVDGTYRDCLAKMQCMHFRHLPVVEEGKLVGIISLRDLLQLDADLKAQEIEMLNYYVGFSPE